MLELDKWAWRPDDVREFESASGLPFMEALWDSISRSEATFVVPNVAIFGYVLDGEHSVVWMAGTDQIRKEAKRLTRIAEWFFGSLPTTYLFGSVDLRNKTHARWLEKRQVVFEPYTYRAKEGIFQPFIRRSICAIQQ